MPTFFGFMKRMAQGKPIYDDMSSELPDDTQAQSVVPQPQRAVPPNGIQKGNASTFPVVRFGRIECRVNGPTMEAYAHIINDSQGRIILDKLRAFGTTRRISDDLRAGEEQPYLIYSGPMLTSDRERDAYLMYKTDTGDYFEARHDVRYTFHNDSKTFSIDELHLHGPIRDIWG